MFLRPAKLTFYFVSLVIVFSVSGRVFAHHAVTVAYDTENLMSIEGEVIDIFWRNPHIVLTVERTLENGNTETWEAESGSTNSLQRIGIGRDIVSIGCLLYTSPSPRD